MRKSLLTSVALSALMLTALPVVHANTNSGAKVYVCATPQSADLDAAGYAALPWILISNVGNHGETGSNTNILTYDTWDTDVIQKTKGITDAGSPEIEVARIQDDAGQLIMRAAGLTRYYYAFKMERNDKPDATGTPTILYNRGLVTGPTRPHGRNEDFDLEMYTLGLVQREIVVDAAAGT